MIENFAHKGLERFSKTGCASGITSSHIPRLKAILALLTQAKNPFEIQDGSLHAIARASGNQRGIYSLRRKTHDLMTWITPDTHITS